MAGTTFLDQGVLCSFHKSAASPAESCACWSVTLHISAGIEGKTAGERLVVLGFTNLLEQSFIQFASGFDKQAAIHFINWCCCHLHW